MGQDQKDFEGMENMKKIPNGATGFRVVRLFGENLREYQPILFETEDGKPTQKTMSMWLNRLRVKGPLDVGDDANILLDFISSDYDELENMKMTQSQFKYLRMKFKFKIQDREDPEVIIIVV